MTEATSNPQPSELQLKARWDRCIEGVVVKTSVGAVLGGLVSMILFRRPIGRAVGLGFGAGIGAGMSYAQCRYEFEHPNICHHVRVKKSAVAAEQQPVANTEAPATTSEQQPAAVAVATETPSAAEVTAAVTESAPAAQVVVVELPASDAAASSSNDSSNQTR